mmetsp:Transcript_71774/g.126719  ORF Transcript_71774/g.126719 Transcript_71774/m.126719 type:complete len:507 (-) Transcript_71774:113-1633(-)
MEATQVDQEVADCTPPNAKVKDPAKCQYFELSPRTSLESAKNGGADENADHNVRRSRAAAASAGKGQPKKNVPSVPVHHIKKTAPATARPSTPTKTRQAEASTPARPLSARSHGQSSRSLGTPARTPARSDSKSVLDDTESVYSANVSVFSEVSSQSRLMQLAKKSSSKRHLSSKELEELEVEEKRRQIRDQIRRNEANCRKAIAATDLSSAGRVQSTMQLTAPKEFNFAPPTPRSPRSPDRSCASSDVDSISISLKGDIFKRNLRSSSSQNSLMQTPRGVAFGSSSSQNSFVQTPQQGWKPRLTVPQGPELNVVRRLSAGRRRLSNSLPPEEVESSVKEAPRRVASRPSTPERRRKEATPAMTPRVTPRVTPATTPKVAPAATSRPAVKAAGPKSTDPKAEGASKDALTRQERAQRAKEMAQKRKDDEAKTKQDRMFVFKRATSPDEEQKSMMSVGSSKSLRSSASTKSIGGPESARGRPEGQLSARQRRPSFGSSSKRPCATWS